MRRPSIPTLSTAIAVAVAATAAPGAVGAAPCWPPPVDAAVSDPYRPPACPWCPGNRGIEYATSPGDPVRAAAAGTVTFAGPVAGVRYVVVEIAGGWRLTYGNVDDPRVAPGDRVVAGMTVGRAAGPFHLGLRDRADAGSDAYLDPTPYLGAWRHRVRLIPTDASAPRPAPAPTLVCPSSGPAAAARPVSAGAGGDNIERRSTTR